MNTPTAAPRRELNLFDSTSIIVGIIIGAGIYESSPLIAGNVPGLTGLLAAWLLGGLLSLVGSLCYAELATAYPHEGGDYVYLTRAFGRRLGFLFAWCQLWVVRPGSIGAMAYIFARYALELLPAPEGLSPGWAMVLYANAAIVVLSVVNILGVPPGKWTQNVLTVAKVLGLVGIVVVGLLYRSPGANLPFEEPAKPWKEILPSFGFAMIFVFYAYGGWNEMGYVGAEVRDPNRNILRALVLGTIAVTAIYVLVNVAFVHALGLPGLRGASAAPVDVLHLALGDWAGRVIAILICISALGAINGMIFTGARIYYAMGVDHPFYGWLGQWNARTGTPVLSLVAQAAITVALVVGFGAFENGFASMVIFTTPVFWVFLLMVALSVFVLRIRDRDLPRPYRVTWFPLPPVLFSLFSAYMIYTSVNYAYSKQSWEAYWSIGLLLAGVVMSFIAVSPPRDAA